MSKWASRFFNIFFIAFLFWVLKPAFSDTFQTGNNQYTDGGTAPTHAIGTIPVFNNLGTIAQVTSSQGLPVNLVAGTAASATGSAVPASASYTGLNVGGTLRGLTGTNTSGSIYAADVALKTLISGEDQTNDLIKVEERYSGTYISTATTTVVKSGTGYIDTLTVTGGTAGTIIVYDNTAASGTILRSFDTTNEPRTYILHKTFATGLTIITSAATKLDVSWR